MNGQIFGHFFVSIITLFYILILWTVKFRHTKWILRKSGGCIFWQIKIRYDTDLNRISLNQLKVLTKTCFVFGDKNLKTREKTIYKDLSSSKYPLYKKLSLPVMMECIIWLHPNFCFFCIQFWQPAALPTYPPRNLWPATIFYNMWSFFRNGHQNLMLKTSNKYPVANHDLLKNIKMNKCNSHGLIKVNSFFLLLLFFNSEKYKCYKKRIRLWRKRKLHLQEIFSVFRSLTQFLSAHKLNKQNMKILNTILNRFNLLKASHWHLWGLFPGHFICALLVLFSDTYNLRFLCGSNIYFFVLFFLHLNRTLNQAPIEVL